MALISCPDCGGKMSDIAHHCIHCGRPNASKSVIPNARNTSGNQLNRVDTIDRFAEVSPETFSEIYQYSNAPGIAVDLNRRVLALYRDGRWHQLAGHLLINAEVVAKTKNGLRGNKTAMLGTAAVGGLLTGGFGAIVGAMLPSKKEYSELVSVELRVIIQDVQIPSHVISFSKTEPGLSLAEKWRDKLTVLRSLSSEPLHRVEHVEEAHVWEPSVQMSSRLNESFLNDSQQPVELECLPSAFVYVEDTPEIAALKAKSMELFEFTCVLNEKLTALEEVGQFDTAEHVELERRLMEAYEERDRLRYEIDPMDFQRDLTYCITKVDEYRAIVEANKLLSKVDFDTLNAQEIVKMQSDQWNLDYEEKRLHELQAKAATGKYPLN